MENDKAEPYEGGGALISVVDDDALVREALPDLLMALGFTVETFASATAFLASGKVAESACLLVDVTMPGMTGPQLQQELKRRRLRSPIIFISAHADEELRRELLAQGAVAFLPKPFSEAALIDALKAALARA